jgi:hypothetical protein
MISEIDETIRQILIHEGGFDPAEVEVSFDIPNREWSAGISRPTINCYLFDIHERRLLREEGWQLDGRGSREAARRHPPLFFELSYLVTAWTRQVEDEHRLLWHVLDTLVRFPIMPPGRLQGPLVDLPWPIHTTVAQLEGVLKSPGEFWTALENQLKPSLSYTALVGYDRAAVPAGPPVLSTGIRLRLPEAAAEAGFSLAALFRLPEGGAPDNLAVEVEGGQAPASLPVGPDGRLSLGGLAPGRYTLAITVNGERQRRTIVVRDPRPAEGPIYADRVIGPDGLPVAGVLVEVVGTQARAISGPDGAFELRGLAPGRHTIALHFEEIIQRREILIRDPGYTLRVELASPP